MHKHNRYHTSKAFTIVELLIVIVVIAILAAITIISYRGIQDRANASSAQSLASQAATKLKLYYAEYNSYPATLGDAGIPTQGLQYTADNLSNPKTYCVTATSANKNYYEDATTNTSPSEGICPGHNDPSASIADGSFLQSITSANCPSTRTRAVDARDNHTYWVQKLSDGKCWMLTNLAYAGGGTNTYNDTKTLTNGTGGSSTYTVPSYYVVPSTTNFTTEPTNPSTSTDGTGQYGYLYNWCASMGAQATAACANATNPAPDTSVSICPSGWRLPSGNGGEQAALNTAINSGSSTSDAGLRSTWLAQRSGYWYNGFSNQGNVGYQWSSNQVSGGYSYRLIFSNTNVNATASTTKDYGFAVRCVAV